MSPAASSCEDREPGDRRARVDPLEHHLVGPGELVRPEHVAAVRRQSRRSGAARTGGTALPLPGSVETRAHTSVSGPNAGLVRQAVHVVVFVHCDGVRIHAQTRLHGAADAVRPAVGQGVLVAPVEAVDDRQRLDRGDDAARRRGRRRGRVGTEVEGGVLGTHAVGVGGRGGEAGVRVARRGARADLVEDRAARARAALDAVQGHSHVVGGRGPGEIDLGRAHRRSGSAFPARPEARCRAAPASTPSPCPSRDRGWGRRPEHARGRCRRSRRRGRCSRSSSRRSSPISPKTEQPAPEQRSMRYRVTPTLSEAAAQMRSIWVGLTGGRLGVPGAPEARCRAAPASGRRRVRVGAEVERGVLGAHAVGVGGRRRRGRCSSSSWRWLVAISAKTEQPAPEQRSMRYRVTPTLSEAAAQVRSIWVGLHAARSGFPARREARCRAAARPSSALRSRRAGRSCRACRRRRSRRPRRWSR